MLSELFNRNMWKVSTIVPVYVTVMDMDTCISRYSGTITLRFVDEGVFFVSYRVIVPATSPLGILESKIQSDGDVHMISVTP